MINERKRLVREVVTDLIVLYPCVVDYCERRIDHRTIKAEVESFLAKHFVVKKIRVRRQGYKKVKMPDNFSTVNKKKNTPHQDDWSTTEPKVEVEYEKLKSQNKLAYENRPLLVRYSDFVFFIRLIRGVEECIQCKMYNPLNIVQQTKSVSKFSSGVCHDYYSFYVENSYKDLKSTSIHESTSRLYYMLIDEQLLKTGITLDCVDDFTLQKWKNFGEFAASAFSNFCVLFNGFSKIKLCKQCGRITLRAKSGDIRGKFCSSECSDQYNDTEGRREIEKCQNKQKQLLQRRVDYLGLPDNSIVEDYRAMMHHCRKCKVIGVGGGKCPVIFSNSEVIELIAKYEQKRLENKNRKKEKNRDDGYEEYTVHI